MELSAIRVITPVFFGHGNQSSLLDNPSKKPWCSMIWEPGALTVTVRDRRTGEVGEIPLQNVSIMAPKAQGEADENAAEVAPTPRVVVQENKSFVDTRLQESAAIAREKKGRKLG